MTFNVCLLRALRRAPTLLALLGLLWMGTASAQTCPPPGSLVDTIPPGGIINDYYAGSGTPNLFSGATSVTLGPRDARGYTTTLVIGDLLMVMQMQDGVINTSNNSNYGNGSGSGNGSTSVGQAGLYEFVRVTAVGANVTFTPALTNNYVNLDATAGTAQKRYQVVRVLQFSSVTTTVAVIAPAWNGTTGGVVAMDVRDTLTLQGQTVETQTNRAIFVAGKGFRGGLGRGSGVDGTPTSAVIADYASSSGGVTPSYHASKGEGFIGTPAFLAIKTNGWGSRLVGPPALTETALAIEGYPGGSYARGAPGNAGGGGVDSDQDGSNSNNSGGGGGGNYGPGGIGGRPWNSPLLDLGGRGGAGYAGTLAFNRIFMGGGGGAGSTNNSTSDALAYTNQGISCTLGAGRCSSGAAGGGTVVIRARQITGSGIIDARGAHGYNVNNDAGGGGGGGGSVVLETVNGGNATVDVTGGDGGNTEPTDPWPGNRHGPGGAGGGGFVAYAPTSMGVTALVGGGTPGETTGSTFPGPGQEYYGGSGFNGGLTTFLTPNTPGVPQAALCDPNLALAKTNGVSALTSPGSNTYTLTVTNSGASFSSGTVVVADRLPPGLTVVPGTLTLTGPSAPNWVCVAATTIDISCTTNAFIGPNGGTSVFAITTAVNGTNGLSIINRALVSGGSDPAKTTTATVTLASTCTGNAAPLAGCAIDTDTILAPNLLLTKTDGTATVSRGSTVVYSLTVTNSGGSTTVGTITVADILPTGLTYSGTTPTFTVNSFTCTVSGQGLTCDRTLALAASSTAVITFTAVVSPTAPSSVLNLAKVGGGGDPSPSKSTRPTTVTAALCAAPIPPANTSSDPDNGCAADVNTVLYVSLDLTKDDGQLFVSTGGSTVYQFTVRNIGTVATSGTLTFGDVLPTLATGSITFTTPGTFAPTGPNGADWSCTRSTITYTFCVSTVSIPAGGTSVFNLGANLRFNVPAGTQITNRARVGGGGDVTPGSFSSPSVANIQACVADGNGPGCAVDVNTTQTAPEVRLAKSHASPQAKSVGDVFAFVLTVTNSGGSPAASATVRIVDVIPPGLTITSVVSSTLTFVCIQVVRVVTCDNSGGALNTATSANITINVTVQGSATNALLNAAKVGATGDPQNSVLPTSVTAAICTDEDVPDFGCAADPVPLIADVLVIKEQRRGTTNTFQTSLLGVSIGDLVQYRLTIANPAPSVQVSSVTFSDLVPFNITGLSSPTATVGGGAACFAAFSGNQLNGTVTSLPTNGTCTVLVQGTASTNSSGATNTVILSIPSGISDTVPGNNSATVFTAIGSANLSVTKTNGVSTLVAGSTTSYTITVANAGPSPGDGARIFDPVAAGLSCVTAPVCTPSGGAVCPVGLTIGQLQNTTPPTGVAIPTLPSGGGIVIALVCTVTATGQ